MAKAYGAIVEHAYPISFEVMAQKPSIRSINSYEKHHVETSNVYNTTLKTEKSTRDNNSTCLSGKNK